MTEKEEPKSKLLSAWKNKEAKAITELLTANPELYKKFALVEIRPKFQLGGRSKALLLSIPISLLISLVLLAFYHYLYQLWGTPNLIFILFMVCPILILLSSIFSSLVSLKPLNFKSLTLPIFSSGLSGFLAVFINVYNPSTALPLTDAFLLCFMGGLFSLLALGLPAWWLTKKIIGLPRCDEPIRISLRLKCDMNTLLNALSVVLKLHFFSLVKPNTLTQIHQNQLAKYKVSTTTEGVSRNFAIAISIYDFGETEECELNALLYRETENAVIADEFCKELMREIVADLEKKVRIEPLPTRKDSRLFEYALGHTKSKIQPFMDNLKVSVIRIPKYVFIAVFLGVVLSYLAVLNWNLIMALKEPLGILGSLFTIISVIVGWLILRRKGHT